MSKLKKSITHVQASLPGDGAALLQQVTIILDIDIVCKYVYLLPIHNLNNTAVHEQLLPAGSHAYFAPIHIK